MKFSAKSLTPAHMEAANLCQMCRYTIDMPIGGSFLVRQLSVFNMKNAFALFSLFTFGNKFATLMLCACGTIPAFESVNVFKK